MWFVFWIHLLIPPFEFFFGGGHGETPMYPDSPLVAFSRPQINLATQFLKTTNTTIQTLTSQSRELNGSGHPAPLCSTMSRVWGCSETPVYDLKGGPEPVAGARKKNRTCGYSGYPALNQCIHYQHSEW